MEKNKTEIKIPEHVGVVIDGNRRWAKERNLKNIEGQTRGYDLIRQCTEWFFQSGVRIVSVYAFSSEDWNQAREDVNFSMMLLKTSLLDQIDYYRDKGIRILVSGRIEDLPGDLPVAIAEIEAETKLCKSGTLQICLNYDGRTEIIDMVKKVLEKKLTEEQIHAGIIRKYLYHGELSDPDIIVRTSGEKSLVGFLTWQSVNSELMFMDKFWPDFEKSDVEKIIAEYGSRNSKA